MSVCKWKLGERGLAINCIRSLGMRNLKPKYKVRQTFRFSHSECSVDVFIYAARSTEANEAFSVWQEMSA